MEHKVITTSIGGMAFTCSFKDHEITVDAKKEFGGNNEGPSAKPLLLMSLAGCSGMDVVSLLRKMRVEYDEFEINTAGKLTEEHPIHYSNINLEYIFKGKSIDRSKVEKAVKLSQEKYCGVAYMLSQVAKIDYKITIQS